MVSRTIICILMFSLLLSVPVRSQQRKTSPDFSEVRKLIQTQMASRGIPSFSIAVAQHGEIIWEEAFGFADKENRIPATKETMYYIASTTKTFTATALKVLEERKQIDFARPVNDYIKPMAITSPRWDVREATVGKVAQHMGGLTTFGRSCYADQPDCHVSAAETIKRYGIVFWRPGDHFDYSNLGYGILGEAIHGASGKSYADFMRDEVFLPLGMNHSSVGIGPGFEKYAAVRYSLKDGRHPVAYSASPAASGIYTTAHDLALFGMFHLKAHLPNQKPILSDKSIDVMQNSTVDTDQSSRYGVGWWVDEDLNGYRSLLGQGGTDDAMAFLRLVPSEEIAVVMLTNTGDEAPPQVVDEILSAMLPTFHAKREANANAKPSPPKPEVKPSSSFVGNWVGHIHTYRGDLPFTLSISASGDVEGKLKSVAVETVKKFEFTDRGMLGRLTGNLSTDEDTGPGPYDLDFELYLKGDTLYGSTTTRPRPNTRYGARLSYWVELKKASSHD